MACADFHEALLHDLACNLRVITLAAEMGEKEMTEIGRHDIRRAVRRRLVGEMPVPAQDALLQTPRAMRAILQHLHVVIRFQHEHVGLADAFRDHPRDVAQISGETKRPRRRSQQIAHRILRIVRNGKGLHSDIANFKTRAVPEQPEFRRGASDTLHFLLGRAVAIDRDAQFISERGQARDVVAVFVRDQDGCEIFRCAPDAGEPLANLAPAKPGIHQHARLVRLDVGAIAGRTAAQNGKVNWHYPTLRSGPKYGNVFAIGFRPVGAARSRLKPRDGSAKPGYGSGMRKSLVLVVLLAFATYAQAGFLDSLGFGSKTNKFKELAGAGLSNDQIAQGLKEALGKGVQNAVSQLGRADGFLTNLNVRIPLPEKLRTAEKTLRTLGQNQMADDFVNSMNRAAEQAVPVAASVFAEAVQKMSIEDARAILSGTNNAATQFFRRTTETNLQARFLPVVQKATEQVGVTSQYKQMLAKVNGMKSIGGLFGNKASTAIEGLDLDAYVTQKALDGLFVMVAEEEKRIRENPMARTTDLLKKVFGSGK